jgi:Ca2+-binding EF-hand superfamily protein
VQRIVQQLRPGRGEALLVFEAMDRDKNGKITLAEFEEAAVSVGFNDEQARRMFAK